jgi:hypothetical protein
MSMKGTKAERKHLRQLQEQRRGDESYVKVTMVLMLEVSWSPDLKSERLHGIPLYLGLASIRPRKTPRS